MKQEYRQIFHIHTPAGWQPGPFEARVWIHPEDAAAVNRRFFETGIKCVSAHKTAVNGYSPRDKQQFAMGHKAL